MREFTNLGSFLKVQRNKNNLTQSELAIALKLHSQFISNWERGLCAPPSHCFDKLIAKLKINREALVGAMLLDSKATIEAKVYKKKPTKIKGA